MWIYRITENIRKKAGLRNHSSRKAAIPDLSALTPQVDDCFLENKNVIISGEFFPGSQDGLKENLLERKANVQSQMTSETELLICGKYPDWMLIEEAKMNGVKVIFIDKASDLFTRFATNVQNSHSAVLNQVPLGI